MRIIALLATYNEERFLRTCLEHLAAQGVDVYLIDNESTDQTVAIAREFEGRGLVGMETLPRDGMFTLRTQLKRKQELAATLDADWFMHLDPDEIRLGPDSSVTLSQAIADADRQGSNVVHFSEFAFIPTQEAPDHEHPNFQQTMRWYYPFSPFPQHRLNAWKKQPVEVSLLHSGGHQVNFPGRKIHPVSFKMRHYHFLSIRHAIQKFPQQTFDPNEVQSGWHGWRSKLRSEMIKLPSQAELREYISDDQLDPSNPRTKHYLGELVEAVRPLPPVMDAPAVSIPPMPSPKAELRGLRRLVNLLLPKSGKHDGPAPVPFVVGVPRSGTTLLRLMLDAHPDLAIPAETHFVPDALNLQGPGRAFRRQLHTLITSCARWNDFHLDSDELLAEFESSKPATAAEGLRCFYRQYARKQKKPRWGDKTPGYVLHVRKIVEAISEVRIIHIIRDGRDVATSLRQLWWGPGKDIGAQAQFWVERILEARNQSHSCPHYLEIRYEDLVRQPEPVLKKICKFVELPFSPKMLRYHEHSPLRLDELSSHRVAGGSVEVTKEQLLEIHRRTRQPPDADRVECWREELAPDEIARYEQVAGDLLRELRYPLATAP